MTVEVLAWEFSALGSRITGAFVFHKFQKVFFYLTNDSCYALKTNVVSLLLISNKNKKNPNIQ